MAPPPPPPGTGCLILSVGPAEDLRKSVRDQTNPYLKVHFAGKARKSEPHQDTENPKFDESFEMEGGKAKEELKVEVWDHQGGLDDLLGEFKVEVGGRLASSDKIFNLQPKPSGQIKLKWEYAFTPAKEEKEQTATQKALEAARGQSPKPTPELTKEAPKPQVETPGELSVEIVKAQNLTTAEWATDVSAYVTFQFGGEEHRTKVKRKSLNPFWNEIKPLQIMEELAEVDLLLMVMDAEDDAKQGDKERTIGVCSLLVKLGGAPGKGVENLTIEKVAGEESEGASEGGEDEESELGTLALRWKYTPPKFAKLDTGPQHDPEEVVLDYVPKITGKTGVVPEKRLYAWIPLFGEDGEFREAAHAAVMGSYTRKERGKGEVPYPNFDSIVENVWKAKTRFQLFSKLRTASESMMEDTALPTPEMEHERKVCWRETMHKMKEVCQGAKVEKHLKLVWNNFAYCTGDPTPEQRTAISVKINKRTYLALSTQLYSHFVPKMSARLSKKIATADWNAIDPGGSWGNLDDSVPFLRYVTEVASFWCETLTECEFLAVVDALLPVLMKARKEVIRKFPTGGSGGKKGKKRPRSASPGRKLPRPGSAARPGTSLSVQRPGSGDVSLPPAPKGAFVTNEQT